jgi:hypothetical protein
MEEMEWPSGMVLRIAVDARYDVWMQSALPNM